MKTTGKLVYLFMLTLFTGSPVFSQGRFTAADFSYPDINGNTQHLYEYLDAGKTVILDVSTTWCGPCWTLHESGLLEEIYEDYGPDGTDELMVLFVEFDPFTNSDDLHGTGSLTYGDWVTGTPYPIIDLPASTDADFFTNNYGVTSVPSVFVICPGYNAIQLSNDTMILDIINDSLPLPVYYVLSKIMDCSTITGTDARVLMYSGDEGVCSNPEISAVIYNNGDTDISSFTVEAYEGAGLISAVNWSGILHPGDTANVNFGNIVTTADSSLLSFDITTTDDDMGNNLFEKTTHWAPRTGNQVRVQITTGMMITPMDIMWRIEDDNANIIEQSGFLDMETTYDNTYTIPLGCHHFIMTSESGSGFEGTLAVTELNSGKVICDHMLFSYEARVSFDVTSGSLVQENSKLPDIVASPNPVSGMLNLFIPGDEQEDIKVQVTNSLGQIISTSEFYKFSGGNLKVDFSDLQKGIYFIKLSYGKLLYIKKVIRN